MPNIGNHSKYNCTANYLKRQRESGDRTCRNPDFIDTDFMIYLLGSDTFQRNDDAEHIDPQYNIYLNSLKGEGNLWIVEANERNALPRSYSTEDASDDGLDQNIRRQKRSRIRQNIEDLQATFSSAEKKRKKMTEMTINPNPFEAAQCLDEEPDTEIDMQDRSTERWNSKHAEVFGKLTERGQSRDDHIDHAYVCYFENYLNVLNDGDSELYSRSMDTCIPSMEGNPEFSADSERSNDGDSELYSRMDTHISSMEGTPKISADSEGSNVNEDDSCDSLGSPSGERNLSFREQLTRVLRKPFDDEELRLLVDRMKGTKPVERHLDLRGGRERSYATNKDGKSYLDYFHDVGRKLYAARSGEEELNLLRGFFFWLQKHPQEGSFKPWKDKECCAIRPRDK